jgi:hypothetical protein
VPRQVLRRVAARTRNSNFAEMVFVGPASELCVDSGGLDLADALFHDAIMLRRCAFRIRAGICCGTMPRDRMCPGGVCAVPVDTVPGVDLGGAAPAEERSLRLRDTTPLLVGQCPVTPAGPVHYSPSAVLTYYCKVVRTRKAVNKEFLQLHICYVVCS